MRGNTSLKFLLASILLTGLFVDGLLYAEVLVQDPGTYVVDTAGVMQASDKGQLEGWLRELEQKTTAQVKVLISRSFGMRTRNQNLAHYHAPSSFVRGWP